MVEQKKGKVEFLLKTAKSFCPEQLAFNSSITKSKVNENSDDSFQSYSSDEGNPSFPQCDMTPVDIIKNFPPPNPLLPKSSLVFNEPLKIGGNIHFL